jgi:ribose transport system ATP-binding protein
LLLALFGVLRGVTGDVLSTASRCAIGPRAPRPRAIGMALIPEDRKTEGLMLPMSVRDNLSFAGARFRCRGSVSSTAREQTTPSTDGEAARHQGGRPRHSGGRAFGRQPAEGGDRQMADAQPRIILLNDPTRGIDVGTKQEIYQLLRGSPTRARRSCSIRPTMTS